MRAAEPEFEVSDSVIAVELMMKTSGGNELSGRQQGVIRVVEAASLICA